MRFLRWCRASFGLNRLARIDERADELASAYLHEGMQQSESAWTLKMERLALATGSGRECGAADPSPAGYRVLATARKA